MIIDYENSLAEQGNYSKFLNILLRSSKKLSIGKKNRAKSGISTI